MWFFPSDKEGRREKGDNYFSQGAALKGLSLFVFDNLKSGDLAPNNYFSNLIFIE